IFQDSKGRLWIGTALNGLNLFAPETEQFIHFTIGTQPALTNNTVYSIQEDKYGALWIATQYGLNKLTVKDGDSGNKKPLHSLEATRNLSQFFSIRKVAI